MRPLRLFIDVALHECCDHRAMFADETLHRHPRGNVARGDVILVTYVRCLLARVFLCALAIFGLSATWAAQNIHVQKHTLAGQEVRIRGFSPFDADCKPQGLPVIEVAQLPSSGEISQRHETLTVGANWVGTTNCTGTQMDSLTVYYLPRAGFEGQDHFTLKINYPGRLGQVRADVDVMVGGKAAP